METQGQRGTGENSPNNSARVELQNAPAGRAGSPLPAADCQPTRSDSPRRRARSDAPYLGVDPLLRARLDAIYTPLETAVAELHDRRRRFAGRTPGRDWLPAGLPVHASGYAFLFRFIATPCFETMRFRELVSGTNLLPVIGGFHQDKFVTNNPIKLGLARMGFQRGINRHGQRLVEFVNVLDLCQQGRPLGDVETLWRQSLIAFHRELLAHALDGAKPPVVVEYSPQCVRAGGTTAANYREHFLRLCLADGILFEDFLLDETELPFTRDVVLPAVDAVTAAHGLKPLIVRLTSPEEETSPHWYWYPGELKAFVQARLLSGLKQPIKQPLNKKL